MDLSIAILLLQDGISSGAIYALLALALVLVYSVTRVPFLPIGGFLTFAALSLNLMQSGRVPWAAALLCSLGLACSVMELVAAKRRGTLVVRRIAIWSAGYVFGPAVLLAAAVWVPWKDAPLLAQMAFALLVTVPMAPMLYRLAFQPIADASTLIIFMVAISVDAAMVGLALLIFGPDGVRNEPYSDFTLTLGSLSVPGPALWILGITIFLVVALYAFFHHSLEGKKLRATAVSRVGAQLVGISTSRAGMLAFGLAAAIAAVSGVLIGSTTTINSSFGVLIGLKGFVAAVIGGFASYPLAVSGALAVGIFESFSSFWASVWKDAIVFTLVIPILLVRSLASPHHEDDH